MDKIQFKNLLSERVVILDGALGTELHRRGYLSDIGAPEVLNIKYPDRLKTVYMDYFKAGSEAVLTNTFGANRLKLKDYGLEVSLDAINRSGVKVAREVAKSFGGLVGADVGPVGAYLSPLGPVEFDEAYDVFSEQIRSLAAESPDFLVIETMADIREVKAALLAAKDNYSGFIIAQMTFTDDGTTVTGTDVLSFLAVAEAMGADAVGMNCSVGPEELARLAKLLASYTQLPISFKPNAGMPKLINRQTVFPGTPEEFLQASVKAHSYGVNLLGGCCGTNPEFIKLLSARLKGKPPAARKPREKFLLSSRTKAIDLINQEPETAGFNNKLVKAILPSVKKLFIVGERINPTNRKKFQEELLADNYSTLRGEARKQAAAGADVLDMNLGMPGADEALLMARAVAEIQEVVPVPLCLDSSLAGALEAGLKACAGKPIINSVNGEREKLDRILPLARRYGAALIGLTTDEKGIPKTAPERIAIAGRILEEAGKAGIPESEVIIDYLTLAASAAPGLAAETLKAITESKKRWPGVKTILGVSNVSFGLPARQVLNSTFLKLAVKAGLDMAILNPFEDWGTDDPLARELLTGADPSGKKYIAKYSGFAKKTPAQETRALSPDERVYTSVLDGNREEIALAVREALGAGFEPLKIANDMILRALNEVGEKFASKEYFLPQVILSAETAQAAFAVIKPLLRKDSGFSLGKIVLATVKGDVHDIGKNIVAAVLESHGWDVIDLGKNVEAKNIVEAALKHNAPLIGLSALMTTTMPEMEKVVRERNERKVPVKILIGGAPVTEKYAKEIGADGYAKDAVRAAQVACSLI